MVKYGSEDCTIPDKKGAFPMTEEDPREIIAADTELRQAAEEFHLYGILDKTEFMFCPECEYILRVTKDLEFCPYCRKRISTSRDSA